MAGLFPGAKLTSHLPPWRAHFCVQRRVSEFLMSPRRFEWPRENDLTQRWDRRSLFVVCQAVTAWREPDRPRKAMVCPTSSPPKPGSTQIPRSQEFGDSTRRFFALGRASPRVPARHRRVRAPRLPIGECEVILALALRFCGRIAGENAYSTVGMSVEQAFGP